MPRLLITGFEGFLGRERNPSWDGLADLSRGPDQSLIAPSGAVAIARIPVAYGAAERVLATLLAEYQPQALIMLGMHGGPDSGGRGAKTFYVETLAHNLDDSKAPDNAGEIRIGRPISADMAPNAPIPSTLPPEWLLDGLAESGEHAAISTDAGRYLCNHLFFSALRLAGHYSPAPLVAFVHVPPSEEMREGSLPSNRFAPAYACMARSVLGRLGASTRVVMQEV